MGRQENGKHGTQCSLPPPPHPLYLRLPPLRYSVSSCPQSEGERRPTISLTILYTSGCEQWRPTTKNSGNRGTAFFSFGWLLHAGPIDIHRPAETDWCQRDERNKEGDTKRQYRDMMLSLSWFITHTLTYSLSDSAFFVLPAL